MKKALKILLFIFTLGLITYACYLAFIAWLLGSYLLWLAVATIGTLFYCLFKLAANMDNERWPQTWSKDGDEDN